MKSFFGLVIVIIRYDHAIVAIFVIVVIFPLWSGIDIVITANEIVDIQRICIIVRTTTI